MPPTDEVAELKRKLATEYEACEQCEAERMKALEERDEALAGAARSLESAVEARDQIIDLQVERDATLVKVAQLEADAGAMRIAIEPAFTEYLGNGEEPTSLEKAFPVFRDSSAGVALLERIHAVIARMEEETSAPHGEFRGYCRWCYSSPAPNEEPHLSRCPLAMLRAALDK